MSTSSRRTFLAGGLTAATLLLAAAGAGETVREIFDDDASVPEQTDATPGKAETEESGTDADANADTDADADAEDVSTTAAEASPGGTGVLVAGDPLFGLPAAPAARAIRGTGEVQLRGAFWLAFPYPPPKPDTAAPTDHGKSAKVTLRVLDLVDTAQDHHIDAGTVQLPTTLRVDSSGSPVRWTARVPMVGVPSGTYRGYLLATREGATSPTRAPVVIPLVVWVKDSPWPTLLILLSGLLLVLGLRAYAALRRKRDEALLKLGDTEARIAEDPLLRVPGGVASPFRRKFAVYLQAAAAGHETNNLADVEANLGRADALWVRWKEGLPDWVPALREERRNIDMLAAVQPPSPHVTALLKELRTGYAAAPDTAVPAEGAGGTNAGAAAAAAYRAAVVVRAGRVARYHAFLDKLKAVRGEVVKVAADKKTAFLAALDEVQRKWDAFATPGSEEDTATKLTELERAIATARREAGLGDPKAAPESATLAAESVSSDAGTRYDPAADELIPGHFRARIRAARGRRGVYVAIATTLVYALLVLYGFKETWGENPEFGADPVADYLGVLVWALGMNLATVVGLAAFASQWSLPWLFGTTPDGEADPAAADPAANPPARNPPADDPPAEDPPVEDPAVEDPPVEDPADDDTADDDPPVDDDAEVAPAAPRRGA